MPRYRVRITEYAPAVPDGPATSPIIRSLDTEVYARSADDAREEAWSAWDEKYGEGQRPAQVLKPLVTLIEGVRVWFVGGPLHGMSRDVDTVDDLPLDYTFTEAGSEGPGFQRGHVYRLGVKTSNDGDSAANEAQYYYEGSTGTAPARIAG